MSSILHPEFESMVLGYQKKVNWSSPVASALHIIEEVKMEHSGQNVLLIVQRVFLDSLLQDPVLNRRILSERQVFVHTILPALVEAQRILKSQRIVRESTNWCCFQ